MYHLEVLHMVREGNMTIGLVYGLLISALLWMSLFGWMDLILK